MKFLHHIGCDIHRTNCFGCNAVLWSAQGDGTAETLAWLFESGSDFNLVNSNGHSAFHKAAQRGSRGAVTWLADRISSEKGAFWSFIGPDAEGHCPSDLCRMEGYYDLAGWISNEECDWVIESIGRATSVKNLIDNYHESIPSWLMEDLLDAKEIRENGIAAQQGGASCGVRRLTLKLMSHFAKSAQQVSDVAAAELIREFNDID